MTDDSQPPYGQPYQPQNPYHPQQPYGMPGPTWAPDHPQGATVLILGILGLVVCQVISPFAWAMGNRVKAEIEASPGRYGGQQQVTIGRILGIIGTAILGLYVLGFIAYIVFFALFAVGASA